MNIRKIPVRGRHDRLRFLGEFVRSPIRTASLTPSSPALAAAMVAPIPGTGSPVVVELGAGTGSFTAAIQRKLGGRGRHVAIELNPRMAELLRERYPEVEVVDAEAAQLPDVLAYRDILAVDAVVSGLPWVAFPVDAERGLAPVVATCLARDGVLTQFAYSWTRWARPARDRLHALHDCFEDVRVTETVWRNVPPAAVYVARRPRGSRPAGSVRTLPAAQS